MKDNGSAAWGAVEDSFAQQLLWDFGYPPLDSPEQ
jgi:hypothetical protein